MHTGTGILTFGAQAGTGILTFGAQALWLPDNTYSRSLRPSNSSIHPSINVGRRPSRKGSERSAWP